MYDDLITAMPEFQDFYLGWMQWPLIYDPYFSRVLQTVEQPSLHTAITIDAAQGNDRQDPAPIPDLGWVLDDQEKGIRNTIYARIFDIQCALTMHEVAVYKKVICPEVQTNQCSKCLFNFSNILSAKRYFRVSRIRPYIVDRSPGNSGIALLQPARHVDR